ncbi:g6480 [Coccomyxa viridis]|uniref:G6480 protein n=1 Tax=Coccomyxa viridis TaxID=1274662 RepID=A0ABP1FWQ8_9CHLO
MRPLVEHAYKLASGLDPYLDAISTPPSQICQDLIEASLRHPWADEHKQGRTQFLQKRECCAGALEGRFIATLAKLNNAKTVLEVGMFTGTTTLAVAQALPDDGKVVACEIEEFMRDFSQPWFERAGVADKVDVRLGPASETLDTLAAEGKRFDLAFLDADKTGYLSYYKKLMDHNLIVPSGAIIVDNSLMKGRTYYSGGVKDEMADAIRDFNEYVRQDSRVDVLALPFRDGVTIITRRPQSGEQDEVATGAAHNNVLQRMKLNNKVALITGGGQGIGRAFAHALGEAGAAVAVVDINAKTAQATAEELNGKGIRSIAVTADITKAKECQRMVDTVVSELGGLDIAVNNAGINFNNAAEDTPESEWDMTFNLNTKGLFLCCQAEGKHMLQQGYGRIINTASMASLLVPHPQKQIAYNASKAAVVKITETLGAEWADRGLTVNCMSPGIVNTALIQSDALKPLAKEWITQIPMGRLAEVTDLEAAIVFMASDASSFMTGHNLALTGGHTLW